MIALAQLQGLLTWLATTSALIYWYRSWRRSRTPGVLAMVRALAALDVAILLGVDLGVYGWLFGIETLPNYFTHVAALFSTYYLQVFVLYLAHPADTIPPKIRPRTRLLVVAQLALGALYLAGPVAGDHPDIASTSGNHAVIVAYLAVFVLYIGLAMVDVIVVSRHARDLPAGHLRLGLRLLRWGAMCGLAFAVHKAAGSLVRHVDLWPPLAPLFHSVVPGILTTAGLLLMTTGIMVPAVGPRLQLRRHHRALLPLWRDLVDFAPRVQFTEPSARRLWSGRGDIADRVRHRLTEINDVLVGPLQPFIDPAAHAAALGRAEANPVRGATAAATAQAVTIATALTAARDEMPVNAVSPVAFTPPDVTDIRDEAAWLATVATAYAHLLIKEQPPHVARAR
ncbi:MAB_1171c family putative transporter [Amycolatopsis sp. cmx-4-54]|uniref:MAB_1171c family putative transporter n=1 Tax=Amycolatopsis sp. cmx-4-54 TaxID=2790936 RepID=UPI00397B1D53